jgi:hypothetical protein
MQTIRTFPIRLMILRAAPSLIWRKTGNSSSMVTPPPALQCGTIISVVAFPKVSSLAMMEKSTWQIKGRMEEMIPNLLLQPMRDTYNRKNRRTSIKSAVSSKRPTTVSRGGMKPRKCKVKSTYIINRSSAKWIKRILGQRYRWHFLRRPPRP